MFHQYIQYNIIWTASSEFGTYRLCEQRRFRQACASAQSRQNLCCSLIQAVRQEELSERKPDPWPLWMAGHAQLKFVMTESLKTQIRLTGLIYHTHIKTTMYAIVKRIVRDSKNFSGFLKLKLRIWNGYIYCYCSHTHTTHTTRTQVKIQVPMHF